MARQFPLSLRRKPNLAYKVQFNAQSTLSGECSVQKHFFQFDDFPTMSMALAILSNKSRRSNALQFIKLQIKYKEKRQVMSINMESDEQTFDESNLTNIQVLIKENNIKDLALNKATSLIQLLSVELEVERNNKQQAMRQIEQQLRFQFSKQLQGMRQKIEFLERQLKRCNTVTMNNANAKTKRQTSLSRSDSCISLQGKKKNSLNKKHTQINSEEGIGFDKIGKNQIAYLQDHFLNLQQWKQVVIDDLNALVNNDYQQLQEIMIKLNSRYSELEEIFSEPVNPLVISVYQDLQAENNWLKSVVSSQKTIINELKLHIQDIEDIYRHVIFKFASVSKNVDVNSRSLDMHDIIVEIKLNIAQGKKEWVKNMANLQDQNIELKNILDHMIVLVQNERRIKI